MLPIQSTRPYVEDFFKQWGEFAILVAKSIPAKRDRLRAVQKCFPSVTKQTRCLEIGCAHGGFTSLIAKTGRWTFNDIDPDNLKVAETILKGSFTSQGAIEYLSGREEPLDLVVCIGTIIYFSDPDLLLKTIHSRLATNGHLLISGREAKKYNPLILLRRFLGVESGVGAKVKINSEQMRSHLLKSDFVIEKTERYQGFFTFCLQTLIDSVNLGSGKDENRLTCRVNQLDAKKLQRGIWFCHIIRTLSLVSMFLDDIFYFTPREGFVFLARKKERHS